MKKKTVCGRGGEMNEWTRKWKRTIKGRRNGTERGKGERGRKMKTMGTASQKPDGLVALNTDTLKVNKVVL